MKLLGRGRQVDLSPFEMWKKRRRISGLRSSVQLRCLHACPLPVEEGGMRFAAAGCISRSWLLLLLSVRRGVGGGGGAAVAKAMRIIMICQMRMCR
jgi:hypothetical protein